MCVTLMHNLHTQTSAVEDIRPGVHHMTLTLNNGLIEVESVEVERHSGDAEGGKPDAHNRPCCQEEVKAAAIVERSILEDQTSEVTVCCNNVVGFFFLPKLVSIVLAHILR